MLSDKHCLLLGFASSVAVHFAALLFIPIPGLLAQRSAEEELIEVDLIPLDYGVLGYGAAAMGASREEAELLAKLDRAALAFAQQLPLSVFIRQPESAPSSDELKVDVQDLPENRLLEMLEKTLDRLATSGRDLGRAGQKENEPWSLPPAEVQEKVRLPDFANPEGFSGPKEASSVSVESIVGPASARRIIYSPPHGEVKITTPGSVRIRFWVEPDGSVARIVFEQKLDANLDDYSARYVRALRFEPLPEGKDYVEWGTITITFRVE